MLNKKSSLIIAAVITMFSFLTVAYVSCTKPGKDAHVCDGVVCQNNGVCYEDTTHHVPVCACPTGYEGSDCSTVSVAKYIGTWDVTQVVIASDSPAFVGYTYHYTAYLQQTATPTTFFIDNLSADPLYNDIICTLDSNNSSRFIMDTISAFHMLYDHYSLLYGSGTIHGTTLITDTFATRHLSPTTNWINDVFSLTMTPHQP